MQVIISWGGGGNDRAGAPDKTVRLSGRTGRVQDGKTRILSRQQTLSTLPLVDLANALLTTAVEMHGSPARPSKLHSGRHPGGTESLLEGHGPPPGPLPAARAAQHTSNVMVRKGYET
jgi:hypothetical protein